MSSVSIPTQEVLFTVSSPLTGFTVNVTSCNLDSDLTVKDFVVINTSDSDAAISTSLWTKSSRTVLTYNGPALTAGHILQIGRSTELERVQETIQLGSTVSSSILDAEILRLYKLIAEKLAGFVVSNPVNNVTRSTSTPNVEPVALGDEWHQYEESGGYGSTTESTIRVWVATDTSGNIDDSGWFEVTGTDGTDGSDGTAATISVGTVTTGAAGSNATVTNVGTTSAAVFNFTIPRGNTGAAGADGADGTNGTNGIDGALTPLEENAQTGTAYTLQITDSDKGVTMDNAGTNTVTIPTNASVTFPIGTRIMIHRVGVGATDVTGDTGVTVNGTSGGTVSVGAQWSAVTLWKRGANTWSVMA